MKKIFVLAVLPALFLFGCKVSGTDSILAPAIKVEAPQKAVSFIQLPRRLEPRALYKSGSFEITPQNGGIIRYEDSYESANGIINIDISLRFPPNSVSDPITVSAEVSQNALTGDFSVTLGPTPNTFLKPALLTFRVTGLDPATLPSNPDNIQFVSMDNDNFVPVPAAKIKIDIKHGSLSVVNGEIFHFSRYGWSTKNDDL
jgi:hypothetical protein